MRAAAAASNQSVPTTLSLQAHRAGGPSTDIPCPSCGGDLERHQPDPERPDRLVGTCLECGDWCLMLVSAGGGLVRLVPLPLAELSTGATPLTA